MTQTQRVLYFIVFFYFITISLQLIKLRGLFSHAFGIRSPYISILLLLISSANTPSKKLPSTREPPPKRVHTRNSRYKSFHSFQSTQSYRRSRQWSRHAKTHMIVTRATLNETITTTSFRSFQVSNGKSRKSGNHQRESQSRKRMSTKLAASRTLQRLDWTRQSPYDLTCSFCDRIRYAVVVIATRRGLR